MKQLFTLTRIDITQTTSIPQSYPDSMAPRLDKTLRPVHSLNTVLALAALLLVLLGGGSVLELGRVSRVLLLRLHLY